ncbi:hypothetical protein F2Q69_00042938 [Brassica cretica]|uniref:Uncharacterized protein n=1 Tax=Brassica cretica TaxID=69181 RepID=A0A8S9NK75_BRACR|nr:hypothetical protein F2Q69_00042938 [Brassica cretica]
MKNSGGIVRDLEVQIGNALVPVDFHVLDIKLNWNYSLLLGRAFLSTVGAVCNLQTDQFCLTLIDPNAYDPIPVKKSQAISRRINDPGIIAVCHYGDEYETEYSESIETHTATSIDSGHQKSTDIPHDESVDSSPDDWENDYYNPTIDAYTRKNMHTDEYNEDFEEERAIEYKAINLPLIDTQPKQRCRERASTDTAYYKSVDTDFNRVREGDYSIGSWADEHHHESFAVDTVTYTTGEDKLQDSFIDEELLNMQKRDDTDQFQAEAAWERTRSSQSIDTRHPKLIDKLPQQSIDINNTMSIDINNTMSIDNHPIQKTTKSTNIPHDESVDSSPDDWENDYYNPTIDAYTRQNMHTDEYDEDFEEERAIEYRAILDEEDKLLHHSSCKRNAPSFDMTRLPSIDTQPQQRCRERASTDTAYYKSVKTDFNRVREGDYSIGS